MGRSTSLTAEGLGRLLESLDARPEEAGARYEILRRKLLWFFDHRGSRTPEEDADETLTRIARKLEQGERIQEVDSYALGVARFVLLESFRRPMETSLEAGAPEPAAPEADVDLDRERRRACMERCLARVSAPERDLILAYYTDDQENRSAARRKLATQLDIPVSALRIRAFRIRQRLQTCVGNCMARRADATNRPIPSVPVMRTAPHARQESA